MIPVKKSIKIRNEAFERCNKCCSILPLADQQMLLFIEFLFLLGVEGSEAAIIVVTTGELVLLSEEAAHEKLNKINDVYTTQLKFFFLVICLGKFLTCNEVS